MYKYLAIVGGRFRYYFPHLIVLSVCGNYPLPSGLFRDNLQHWLGDFARLLKVQFT